MGKTQSTGNLTNALAQDSSNNIGIGGAANASFKLQVTGATNLTGALTGTSAEFSGNNHSLASNNTLRFTDTDTATEANQQIGKIEFYSSDTSTPGAGVKAYIGAFAQDTTPDAYLSFATQDGSATPNPVERLRISSEGAATFSNQVTMNGPAADWAAIIQNTNSTSGYSYGLKVKAGTSAGTDATFVLQDYAGNEFLTARGNGRIGIGTSSPTNPLHIVSNTVSQLNVAALSGNTNAQINLEPTGTGVALIGPASAFPLTFRTDATERMRITSNGNVGIGTSSPSERLHLYQNASSVELRMENNTISSYIRSQSDNLNFYVNGGERMRITSGGNVVIGGTTAQNNASSRGNLTINGTTSILNLSISDTNGGYLYHGGTDMLLVNAKNGAQLFYTNDTERMKILANGITLIYSVYSQTSGAAANVIVGSDGNLFRSTSSLKYKKNVENYTKGLAEVMQLRPVTYNGINELDGDKQFAGLIAEDVHELGFTEFVQYAEDGTPDALAYQNMIALLVKGMQEQQAQIEELKGEIDILKAK
jgi:hypothetical protein